MKTDKQIRALVASQAFKSQADYEMIIAFCNRLKTYIRNPHPSISAQGIDVSQFIEWYNNGFGTGDLVLCENKVLVLGLCNPASAHVIGSIDGNEIKAEDYWADNCSLSLVFGEKRIEFLRLIAAHGFQIENDCLSQKYIPQVNDRVDFASDSTKGVGVVRSVNFETGEVELYCYFLYKTKQTAYSMHEKGICNIHDFVFTESSRSSQKRLSRELARFGKEWNEKLHRIQPINYKLPKGEKYYVINEKLKVVSFVERDNFTSMSRRNSGNYFHSNAEALDMVGKIHELLRDNLAK